MPQKHAICALLVVICACSSDPDTPANNSDTSNSQAPSNTNGPNNSTNNTNNSNNTGGTNNETTAAECDEGERRVSNTPCGLNGAGYLEDLCADGRWTETSDCQDPDECTERDTRPASAPCGLFGTGTLTDVCINGEWRETDTCDDPTTVELLKDIHPTGSSSPLIARWDRGDYREPLLGEFDDRVAFYATDADSRGIWVSDGTAEGTVQLADFGNDSYNQYGVVRVPNGYVFGYVPGLWFTNGTKVGTVQLFGNQLLFPESGSRRYVMQGADIGLFMGEASGERSLYTTDGTITGTTELLALGTTGKLLDAQHFEAVDRTIYLIESAEGAHLLYCFDGMNGTNLDWVESNVDYVTGIEHDGLFYFSSSPDGDLNRELWRTDCTGPGTQLVVDLSADLGGSSPSSFSPFGDRFLFTARPTGGDRMQFVSDGTAAGTFSLSVDAVRPRRPSVIGDRAYFAAGLGAEPWVTDGTVAGTVQLGDLDPGPSGSMSGGPFLELDGLAYFKAQTGSVWHVWRTDGTPEGTERITTTPTSLDGLFDVAGGRILFDGVEDATGTEVWVTDGTPFTERRVADINPGTESSLFQLSSNQVVEIGQTILFTAKDGTNGEELWAIRY